MIDQNEGSSVEQETTGGPIVEVDAMDFTIDGETAVLDEAGRVVSAISPEGKRVYLKGSTAAQEAKGSSKAAPVTTEEGEQEEGEAEVEGDTAEGQDADEPEYENHADYILKAGGYKEEEIALGDGSSKSIKDLTDAEQLDLIVDEFDRTRQGLEAQIQQLKEENGSLKLSDPAAQQVVDYLRNGGDLQQLAKEIISSDPAAQAKLLTDEQVNRLAIKRQFPTFSDEEVDAELKDMNDAQRARRAKAYRAILENEKPDLSKLTDKQKAEMQSRELETIKAYDANKKTMVEKAKAIKEIAGAKIDDNMRNYLLRETVPQKAGEDSSFVKQIIADPGLLLELKFYHQFGKKMISSAEDFHYKRGLAEGRKVSARLPEEKILKTFHLDNGNSSRKSAAPVKDLEKMTDEEFAKFLEADSRV